MSVQSCLSPGTGAMRPPCVHLVQDWCLLVASAVVIPGGEIVISVYLARHRCLRFERGKSPLQEIEGAAEFGQLPRRGPRQLCRELLSQSPLDERARGQTSVGQCQAEPPAVIKVR